MTVQFNLKKITVFTLLFCLGYLFFISIMGLLNDYLMNLIKKVKSKNSLVLVLFLFSFIFIFICQKIIFSITTNYVFMIYFLYYYPVFFLIHNFNLILLDSTNK